MSLCKLEAELAAVVKGGKLSADEVFIKLMYLVFACLLQSDSENVLCLLETPLITMLGFDLETCQFHSASSWSASASCRE